MPQKWWCFFPCMQGFGEKVQWVTPCQCIFIFSSGDWLEHAQPTLYASQSTVAQPAAMILDELPWRVAYEPISVLDSHTVPGQNIYRQTTLSHSDAKTSKSASEVNTAFLWRHNELLMALGNLDTCNLTPTQPQRSCQGEIQSIEQQAKVWCIVMTHHTLSLQRM